MSGKFKNGWRKVKDGVSLGIAFIPIVLLGVALVTVMLLIGAVIKGAIVSVCWNIAMTTMFGFSKVTMFQAFVLAFTIGCLRANYFSSAKSEYEDGSLQLQKDNYSYHLKSKEHPVSLGSSVCSYN